MDIVAVLLDGFTFKAKTDTLAECVLPLPLPSFPSFPPLFLLCVGN